jgi:hypothetical protein
MNIKRAFLVLVAALLMPGLALAQGELGPANFAVRFDFLDLNDVDTSVARISCNAGLPLENQQVVRNGSEINFVLTFADEGPGLAECVITVDEVSGYTAQYLATGESEPGLSASLLGCFYNNVSDGDSNLCVINMDLDPVIVFVGKEWEVDQFGSGGDVIDTDVYIEVSSDAPIVNGHPCFINGEASEQNGVIRGKNCQTLFFKGPGIQVVGVIPLGGATKVYLHEEVFDSAIDVRNTCGTGNAGEVTVFPGVGAECLFINTVFFEGIPTLNQYGLAIMALLMLGVGFVGFRRFV